MYLNENLKYCYHHVPKTGGHSILKNLRLKDHRWITIGGMHAGYDEVEKKQPEKFKFIKDNCTKICMVRNPWSHAVSFYFHKIDVKRFNVEPKRMPKDEYSSFDKFVEKVYEPQETYTFKRKIFMNDIWYKFEDFENNWVKMCELFGYKYVPSKKENLTENRENVFNIEYPKNYRDMYTNQKTIDIVAEMAKNEISMFNYQF